MTTTRRKAAAPAQLSMFALLEAPAVNTAIPEWVTGAVVDRSGLAAYRHLIRSPEDPERGDIRKLPAELRDRKALWQRTLNKSTVESWMEPILVLLSDGLARTFNRIGVELLDKTADVLFESPPEAALWRLVTEKRVEHTMAAPVFFRLAVRQ